MHAFRWALEWCDVYITACEFVALLGICGIYRIVIL